MRFLYCAGYVALLGMLSNLLGPMIPPHWFRGDRFPFRCFRWEKEGKFYLKFHIRAWKDKVPDMSRISKRVYPKQVKGKPDAAHLRRLIQESCLAETVHTLLILLSLGVTLIWRGTMGWIFWLIYVAGNLPSMMIQRFNRPRLLRALRQLEKKQNEAT